MYLGLILSILILLIILLCECSINSKYNEKFSLKDLSSVKTDIKKSTNEIRNKIADSIQYKPTLFEESENKTVIVAIDTAGIDNYLVDIMNSNSYNENRDLFTNKIKEVTISIRMLSDIVSDLDDLTSLTEAYTHANDRSIEYMEDFPTTENSVYEISTENITYKDAIPRESNPTLTRKLVENSSDIEEIDNRDVGELIDKMTYDPSKSKESRMSEIIVHHRDKNLQRIGINESKRNQNKMNLIIKLAKMDKATAVAELKKYKQKINDRLVLRKQLSIELENIVNIMVKEKVEKKVISKDNLRKYTILLNRIKNVLSELKLFRIYHRRLIMTQLSKNSKPIYTYDEGTERIGIIEKAVKKAKVQEILRTKAVNDILSDITLSIEQKIYMLEQMRIKVEGDRIFFDRIINKVLEPIVES